MAETSALEELRAKARTFLEAAPLFSTQSVELGEWLTGAPAIAPHTLDYFCRICRQMRQFTDSRPEIRIGERLAGMSSGAQLLEYLCGDCKQQTLGFWVRCEQLDTKLTRNGTTLSNRGIAVGAELRRARVFALTKIGQTEFPAPTITSRFARMLDDDREMYRKALTCIGAGLGIAAHAYLRRVVEDRTGYLLDRLGEVLKAEADLEGLGKLNEAREGHAESERLKAAAETLPRVLRRGGKNPLAILYRLLSENLHGASDEAALESAKKLQQAFELVFATLADHLREIAELDTIESTLK